MKRTFTLLEGLLVLVVLCIAGGLLLVGLKRAKEEQVFEIVAAGQLAQQQGVRALMPEQVQCYVCGDGPLKADHYYDVKGGRCYFDKAECVDAFKEQPEYYLKMWGLPPELYE